MPILLRETLLDLGLLLAVTAIVAAGALAKIQLQHVILF